MSPGAALSQEVGELVVHDLDDLLARLNRLDDSLTQSPLLDSAEKVAGNLVVDVRFQERSSHLPQALLQHLRRDDAALPEGPEDAVQSIAEPFEHLSAVCGSGDCR